MSFGVRGLDMDFGDVAALRGVHLDVPRGSIVAVVGGDGAGKTTLLRCLVGRLAPTAGEVVRPERNRIGYMPSTSGTWRDLTVDENIDFAVEAYAMDTASRRRRRGELLERAALTDASHRPAGDLSGGMRQKLGFVLAVLHEPDLLVLDEPSTGVDPVSRVELWRLIADAAASGAAVAMATTYLDEAERASRIVVLDGGLVIADGTRDEVIASTPGYVTAPSVATCAARAWRRGDEVREWHSDDEIPADDGDGPVLTTGELEFEDVVIARLLDKQVAQHRVGGS
ncbi:MAG: ABC transporter ATP-binding protein [Acidimicrobiia bacterium]